MSQNPFDGPQQTNPGDQLYFEGKQIGGSGAGGDNVVRFDPATQTVSPNGQMMMRMMLDQMRKDQVGQLDAVAEVIGDLIAPYEERISQLEEQLAKAQADVTSAIGKALHQFNDDDNDATQIVKSAMAKNPEVYR